jgi:hypothetical protein
VQVPPADASPEVSAIKRVYLTLGNRQETRTVRNRSFAIAVAIKVKVAGADSFWEWIG